MSVAEAVQADCSTALSQQWRNSRRQTGYVTSAMHVRMSAVVNKHLWDRAQLERKMWLVAEAVQADCSNLLDLPEPVTSEIGDHNLGIWPPPRSTQLCIPPGSLNRVPALGEVKAGKLGGR